MARRLAFVIGWVVATALAVVLATAAVGLVRAQVADPAAVPVTPLTDAPVVDDTLPPDDPASSTTDPTAPDPSTSTTSSSTSTTSATTSTSTTSTTGATATTGSTSTTVTAEPKTATFHLVGGSLAVSYTSSEVTLLWATPKSGFTVEIESGGPVEVEVDFESSNHKSRFRAQITAGELDPDIEEESD